MMPLNFKVAGGSTTGSDHRKGMVKNNQDAFSIRTTPRAITAIVADGCSGGADSEVGAKQGAALITTYLHKYLARGFVPDERLLARVRQDLITQLHITAREMGESLSEVVNRYFLFTLNGVAITEQLTTFFAIGDGVVIVNGEVAVLKPEAGNQPIYVGYILTGSALTDHDPSLLDFQIVCQLQTDALSHFLIGTDGVNDAMACANRDLPGTEERFGPISQFWEDERFLDRPVAISRRLNLLARENSRRSLTGRHIIDAGLLPDDTTFVTGRQFAAE